MKIVVHHAEYPRERISRIQKFGGSEMVGPTTRIVKATTLMLAVILLSNPALGDARTMRRRGRVIIIRGAFTVFSLGMNDLGDKLSQYGLDVDVIADISAGWAAAELKDEYLRGHKRDPIIFIGHSRGAELGPKQARYLQEYNIPVRLVVMVDAVHETSIPANVQRCVHFYQKGSLGMPHGVPARAESKHTQLINADIDRLRTRSKGGSLNHFNIDSSAWIHDLVINEVLRVCPEVTAHSAQARSRRSAPVAATRSAQPRSQTQAAQSEAMARWRSHSGLRYPSSVARGYWSSSATRPAAAPSKSRSSTTPGGGTQRSRGRTYRMRSSTSANSSASRTNRTQGSRSQRTARAGSRTKTGSKTPPKMRTAARPPARTQSRSKSLQPSRSRTTTKTKRVAPKSSASTRSKSSNARAPATKKKGGPIKVQLRG